MSCRIAIVGGGVIGLSTAYQLAKAGADVTVYERGALGREASWAGAGIISPGEMSRPRTPLERLGAFSADLFPELSHELRTRTGIDNGYQRCGGLTFGELPFDDWHAAGIVAEPCPEPHRRFPALSDQLPPAAWLSGVAQVRNPRHLQALALACEQLNVRLHTECPITELKPTSRGIGIGTDTSDKVLLAGGAWTDELLRPLGVRLGVTPIRGQIVLFHAERPLISCVIEAGLRYLVPREDGRLLAGSTEEAVGFTRGTTDNARAELLAFATSLLPALATTPIERQWSGFRPGSPHGRPIIGPLPQEPRIVVATGHFRAGLQLSPGTAVIAKNYLLNLPQPFDCDLFRPSLH